jgi:hypothetical protein
MTIFEVQCVKFKEKLWDMLTIHVISTGKYVTKDATDLKCPSNNFKKARFC